MRVDMMCYFRLADDLVRPGVWEHAARHLITSQASNTAAELENELRDESFIPGSACEYAARVRSGWLEKPWQGKKQIIGNAKV